MNAQLKATFISDVTNYFEEYDVDGFDIDWEFPVWSGDGAPTDKKCFTALLEVINFHLTFEEFLRIFMPKYENSSDFRCRINLKAPTFKNARGNFDGNDDDILTVQEKFVRE